eukprot:2804782-Pyramimonas_sp.AAC.1
MLAAMAGSGEQHATGVQEDGDKDPDVSRRAHATGHPVQNSPHGPPCARQLEQPRQPRQSQHLVGEQGTCGGWHVGGHENLQHDCNSARCVKAEPGAEKAL